MASHMALVNVADYYRNNCVKIIDKIVKAKDENALVKIAEDIKWPLEAVVSIWCMWKMGVERGG